MFFRWVDGSTLHYAPWAQGEPNFASAQEHCVVLDKKYGELHFLRNIFLWLLPFCCTLNVCCQL